jgi:hypothetical protein
MIDGLTKFGLRMTFVFLLSAGGTCWGQAAQIRGAVRGDDGKPIPDAYVTVSVDAGTLRAGERPEPGFRPFYASTRSGPDGSFVVSGVPAGKHRVCAQVPNSDWISPCQWTGAVPPVAVAASQTVTAPLTLMKAHRLKIRLDDREKHLEKHRDKRGSEVIAGALAAQGLFSPAQIASQDAGGRDYDVLVPYDTEVDVVVSSSYFVIADEKGNTGDGRGRSERARVGKGQNAKTLRFSIVGVSAK